MEGAAEILVYILAAVLAILLILGIVLAVVLIKLTKTLKRVADKAEHVVGNVESAASALRNAAGPLAAGKVLVNIAKILKKRKG